MNHLREQWKTAAGTVTLYRGMQLDWIEVGDDEEPEEAIEYWVKKYIWSGSDMEREISKNMNPVGSHWSTSYNVGRQYAEADSIYSDPPYGMTLCAGVILEAEVSTDDIMSIEEAERVLGDDTLREWHKQEQEKPVRPGAKLHITNAEFIFTRKGSEYDLENFSNPFSINVTAVGPSYERITYRPEDENGNKLPSRTIYMQDPKEITFKGVPALIGAEVEKDGTFAGTIEVSRRTHVIQLELVTKRTPMKMNMTYGELEPA